MASRKSLNIHVLYINLAYRTDRNKSLKHNLLKYGFNMKQVHRVDAVLNQQCGHIGCGESHVKALKLAIENGWDKVLILEDDFTFDKPIEKTWDIFEKLDKIPWDVVLLADGHKSVEPCEYPFLKRIKSCTTASGYIIRKHYYETLLKNFEESVRIMKSELINHIALLKKHNTPFTKLNYCTAIDQHWFSLQKKDIFYLCDPTLGVQNCGYSDNNCSLEHQQGMISKMKGIK